MAKRARRAAGTIVGRLKAADPFELIRWLARSQPDPRKALAELVQNSIDAGAHLIHITRVRERGVTILRVLDDGEGVIPELGRPEALTYIATHIGHSRKRNLTPEQRRELMLQGKYGIGLLGFWAIGERLEIRSKVMDASAWLLRMHEDSPHYEVERFRGRLSLGERYTEVVVRGLHRPAFLSLTARRTTEYLAAELRGQLLSRNLRVLVFDRIARGRAPKVLEVTPARFEGERLAVPEEIPTDGFPPVRAELYLLAGRNAEERKIAILCNGTVVYNDVTELEIADFRHAPWLEPRLTGLLEFPAFEVSPGSRRGVLPDRAAWAFAMALRALEPEIHAQLQAVEERATAEIEADVLRQLERAFRDVPRLAPEYDFFAVRGQDTAPIASAAPPAGEEKRSSGEPEASGDVPEGVSLPDRVAQSEEREEEEAPILFPAGALASLQVIPAQTRVERLGQRRVRAEARDPSGIRITRDLSVRWKCADSLGHVEPAHGAATVFQAGPETGAATVAAVAEENGQMAQAECVIEVVDVMQSNDAPRAGIPEPVFIDEPASGWRSRMINGRWEVNSGHPDFRISSGTARRKVRYLTALLGKEIVMHSFPAPQIAPVLERLVGLLTITERRLERG